jgi:hypothetical protein
MSPSKLWVGWKPPRELDRPLPRPVRLTGGGIAMCLFAAFAIAGGVWIAADNGRQAVEERRVLAQGRETGAVVTRLGRGKFCLVDYRFTAGGREYDGSAPIAPQHFDRLGAGQPIAVRYLPSDPAHSFPSADPPAILPLWGLLLPGALFAGAGSLMLIPVWLNWSCLARGRPAPAVVTRVGGRRGSAFTVSYEFPLPEGAACQGSRSVSGNPPPEGSAICVLYHPANPRLNAMYPPGLVKLATN